MRLHEPSLRHVRRLHVMLTTELHSVQPTILLPSPDAARQCHLHREAEDDIVRKLIQLLAKFDVHSTVRDAMRIAEQLASDGDRLVTASEFRRLRDYVLIEVARSNGQRSGGVLEMTEAFRRDSLAVQDRRDTRARSRRRDSGRSTSPALVRPTASRARQQQSVLVHRCMTKDTYRRRTPAASPPPVPAWR